MSKKKVAKKIESVFRLFFSQLKMVFRSDPRAGYCTIDFNVEWFYQYLDDRGEQLVFKTMNDKKGYELDDDDIARREERFHQYLERAVECYIGYSIFGNKSKRIILYQEYDMSHYDNIYYLLYDVMLEFQEKYPDYFTVEKIAYNNASLS